ncbi:MAG: hypothetical protein ACI9TY_001543 [Alphaproteobacteria bacterium]|jgi:hypothetical protein
MLFIKNNYLKVSAGLAVFIVLSHAYLLSKEPAVSSGGFTVLKESLLLNWGVVVSLFIITFALKRKSVYVRYGMFTSGVVTLIFLLLFTIFLLFGYYNQPMKESALIYIVPLIYPIIFIPMLFCFGFIGRYIYQKFFK